MYSVQNLSYVLTAEEMTEKLNDSSMQKFVGYFNKIKGASIKEHEIISEYVRKVTFDNGVTVYVNYGYEDVNINGFRIRASDFEYSEGGVSNG
jgi:hypothetical protein